jgi:hypothetical protein
MHAVHARFLFVKLLECRVADVVHAADMHPASAVSGFVGCLTSTFVSNNKYTETCCSSDPVSNFCYISISTDSQEVPIMVRRTDPKDDDWQNVTDAKKRKQIQDRLAQRARRKYDRLLQAASHT